MDDTTHRELGELAALLAKHGPAQILMAIGALCTQALEGGVLRGEDVPVWSRAAEATQRLGTRLLEGADELAEGETSDDDGDELAEGEASDDDGDELAEGEASDDDGDELAEGASLADDAPRSAPGAAARNEETPSAPEQAPPAPEDTTMARDPRLGPRPANATHWRCFRTDSTSKSGAALTWFEDGFGSNEWPIRSCSSEVIAQRWGEGAYVVQYIAIDNEGKRRPCGRSKAIHVAGRAPAGPPQAPASSPSTPSDARAELGASTVHAAPPPPPLQATVLPPVSHAVGGDFATVLSMMSFLSEQSERARASAAADARAQIERAQADARLAAERYRAELDAQLERERIASQERIALAQAQAQLQAKAVRAAGPLDPDALAAKIGEVVGAKLQEAHDDEDDDEESAPPVVVQAPPAPADNTAKLIDALKETLTPIVGLLATYLQQQAQANNQTAPVGHAAE